MGKGGAAGSLKDLLKIIYIDLFAYSTDKVVKSKDWRLGAMKRTFNIAVVIYILFYMVLYHGYFVKEVPVITLSTIIDVGDVPAQLALFNTTDPPMYCNPANTNYTWGPLRVYENTECVNYYSPFEYAQSEFMGVWLNTFWQQYLFNRTAANNTVLSPNNKMYNASIFPTAAEYTTVTIVGTYTTSWGVTRSGMNTTVTPDPSVLLPITNITTYNFPPGTPVTLSFLEIMNLAGIDPDATNEITDGGEGPPWPIYRMTGIEIAMQLQFYNFVETLFPMPDPFNFNDYLLATVFPVSVGTFRGPGQQVWYLGNDTAAPDSLLMVRHPRGVLVSFQAAGSIGIFSFGSAFGTLLGAMVLMNMTANLIDILAVFIIEGFREQKFEDELEQRIRDIVRYQLADVPTRAEVSEEEVKALQARMEAEQAEEAAFAAAMAAAAKAAKREERAAARAAGVPGASSAGDDANDGGRHMATSGPRERLGPRVLRLVIAGENHHGIALLAQGFLESCRCVRFQWYRSRDGVLFEPVAGATLPSFFATADDVGCVVAVEATPVSDDGFEGEPLRAKTQPLRTLPSVLARVRRLAAQARALTPLVVEDALVSGVRCRLRISEREVEATTASGIELGAIGLAGLRVTLDRVDPLRMRLTQPETGAAFDTSWPSPEARDLHAVLLRELAGDSIALRNEPAYMAAADTGATDDDEDEEDDSMGEDQQGAPGAPPPGA